MTETEFKKLLWDSANKLRGAMSAAEYKFPVLGLVFLKYVSDIFEAQREVIRARLADPVPLPHNRPAVEPGPGHGNVIEPQPVMAQ